MISWSAWELDVFTWGWIFFMLYFLVWEGLAVYYGAQHTLTWHLRPIFHAAPVTWYIGIGIWLWMGPHFFWPAAENVLRRTVGG